MYAAQPSKELATVAAYLLDATGMASIYLLVADSQGLLELGDQWTTNVKEVAFQITQGVSNLTWAAT